MTTEDLFETVCQALGTEPDATAGTSRQMHLVDARQVYFLAAYKLKQYTNKEIGAIVHRKHSTAICARQKALELLICGDERFTAKYETFRNYLALHKGIVLPPCTMKHHGEVQNTEHAGCRVSTFVGRIRLVSDHENKLLGMVHNNRFKVMTHRALTTAELDVVGQLIY